MVSIEVFLVVVALIFCEFFEKITLVTLFKTASGKPISVGYCGKLWARRFLNGIHNFKCKDRFTHSVNV